MSSSIPTRLLGNTGLRLPILSFGASSLGGEFRSVKLDEALASVRVALDRACDIEALQGLGDFGARKTLPHLRSAFFDGPIAEKFVPCHVR